jgi:NCS2 family nucleobase:cation symporter-2
MMHTAGLDSRNTMIAATSICLGVGVTQVDGFFDYLPPIIGQIFAGNMVAGVFITGLVMELLLPKDPAVFDIEDVEITDPTIDDTDNY